MDLRNVRKVRVRIERLKEHIEVLNSAKEYGERLTHLGGKSNYPTDRMSRIVARIAELTDELVSCALDYDVEVTLAEEAISKLSEPEQKIARARYLDGLSWNEVAKKTGYSKSHCWNTNSQIIKKVSSQ